MLYFRGCTAREKQTNIQKATEFLLNTAGIDYHILDDEKCCGSVLLRTGFESEAKEQIKRNAEIFNKEKILTSCAGCYKTLKEDYEGLDVIHISQLLDELIRDGKLDFTVANLVEMENIRENSLCCGAGGGVKSAYPEIADQMASSRIAQAKDTDCEILITSCPFCKLNLENDDLEVLDLTEFLVKYGDFDEIQ